MTAVCLAFHAHLPWRLRNYNYFDVGVRHDYFGLEVNRRRVVERAERRFAPAFRLLSTLLERHPKLGFGLTLSSTLMDLLHRFAPEVLAGFRQLAATGRVEPLATTSHRCLGWAVSAEDSEAQILAHREHLRRELGSEPRLFGGEEVPDVPGLAAVLETRGFRGMLLDDDRAAADAPSGGVLLAPTARGLPVLLARAPRLDPPDPVPAGLSCFALDLEVLAADDAGAGLSAPFASWIDALAARPGVSFPTPSGAIERAGDRSEMPRRVRTEPFSNQMQRDAWSRLGRLEAAARDGDSAVLEDFRRLTSSRHFEQMAFSAPGDIGRPPDASYEGYMAFCHAVSDLERRLSSRPAPSPVSAPRPTA